jgi:hypothetical protein
MNGFKAGISMNRDNGRGFAGVVRFGGVAWFAGETPLTLFRFSSTIEVDCLFVPW